MPLSFEKDRRIFPYSRVEIQWIDIGTFERDQCTKHKRISNRGFLKWVGHRLTVLRTIMNQHAERVGIYCTRYLVGAGSKLQNNKKIHTDRNSNIRSHVKVMAVQRCLTPHLCSRPPRCGVLPQELRFAPLRLLLKLSQTP